MKNKLLYYFLAILIFHLVWYLGAIFINSPALVNPLIIYQKIFFDFDFTIINHAIASLKRVVISVVISIVLALLITLLMNQFKMLDNILKPIIYLLYPIPKTALLPVLMTLQGLGNTSKITLLVLITIFQIIVYLQSGLDNIKANHLNVLKSLGASSLQTIRYVKIPAILSTLIASVKVSFAGAFAILFLIETYGTTAGLGYYIQDAWNKINYVDMYYGILISGVLCLVIFLAIEAVETKMKRKGY